MIKKIWLYRNFILTSIINDFKVRFSRSKAGLTWMIIHPLAQALIYTIVLSSILASKLPNIDNKYAYTIYLLSGLLCWNLFSETFLKMINIFTDNGNLIKKVSFPKITLPAIVAGTALVNNVILFLSMMIIFLFIGHYPDFTILLYLPLVLLNILFATGLGIMLAIFNVFVRDIYQIVNIIIQFWFWLTPIVYIESIIPDAFKKYLSINPLYGLVKGYHSIFLMNEIPDWHLMIYPSIISFCFLLLGFFFYKKGSEEMADML